MLEIKVEPRRNENICVVNEELIKTLIILKGKIHYNNISGNQKIETLVKFPWFTEHFRRKKIQSKLRRAYITHGDIAVWVAGLY